MARPTIIGTALRGQRKALDDEHYRRQGKMDEAIIKIRDKPMKKIKEGQ